MWNCIKVLWPCWVCFCSGWQLGFPALNCPPLMGWFPLQGVQAYVLRSASCRPSVEIATSDWLGSCHQGVTSEALLLPNYLGDRNFVEEMQRGGTSWTSGVSPDMMCNKLPPLPHMLLDCLNMHFVLVIESTLWNYWKLVLHLNKVNHPQLFPWIYESNVK